MPRLRSSFITPEPELGAFVLLKPQAEHLLCAVGADAQRDMDRLVADHAFIADLHSDRVEKDQRVNRIERPLLPGGHFIEHGVRHRADQVRRYVDAVKLVQVPGDLHGCSCRARTSTRSFHRSRERR